MIALAAALRSFRRFLPGESLCAIQFVIEMRLFGLRVHGNWVRQLIGKPEYLIHPICDSKAFRIHKNFTLASKC
jgi:hypothetical protein